MALVVKDRVRESSTTTGTGTVSLGGATSGFQTFVAGVGTGNTTYYAIEDANGTAWEVGLGTVTDASPDTLARTTILANSNGDTSAITLTSGTHSVFATYPAGKAVYLDADGLTNFALNDLPDVSFGGTNLTQTLLINNSPGSAPTHGTLSGDNQYNVGVGHTALSQITAASFNVAIGHQAQRYATDGTGNVALGASALMGNSDGTSTNANGFNVGVGYQAGYYIETGDYNTFVGCTAGQNITTGNGNVGVGSQSAKLLTEGIYNVAVGQDAANGLTTGDYNVAIGYLSGYVLGDGEDNVAIGHSAGRYIRGGDHNVAIGTNALQGHSSNTASAERNVAIGDNAGMQVETGDNNVLIGNSAGYDIKTGSQNICIGNLAGYAEAGSSMLYIASHSEAAYGTIIKGDMVAKHLAIGMADVTLATEDAALQVYPKATNDSAYFAKMPSSHTGDLIRIENSSGTELFKVDKDGDITAGTVTVSTSPVVPYTTITGDTTVTTANVAVFANATSGEIDVTMYAATSNGGRTLTIKKIDSSANAVVITRAGSETIDGATSVTLIHQNEAVTLISDNSNWHII